MSCLVMIKEVSLHSRKAATKLNQPAIAPVLIALSLLFNPALWSQSSEDALFSATILFKVTHPESNHTSYLFGTHHAFGQAFFDSLTEANQALDSCDLVIKENLNIPGQMATDIINGRTATTNWRRFTNREDLAFIEKLFATSPTDFQKMTPTEMYAFLNRYFKQNICLSKATGDTSLSLDDYIGSKALAMNLELIGLETTSEQISLINKDVEGMPRRTHQRRLANIIEKIRSGSDSDCEETDWYRNMVIDYQLQRPCANSLVLTDRNGAWMNKIIPLLETSNCFIAVGLSHLMFECGLISQLEALGYRLEPIPFQ